MAVCAGTGLADIFKGIGADVVIEGGQTMNPSTEDILKAVEQASADTVYVLPNNKKYYSGSRTGEEAFRGLPGCGCSVKDGSSGNHGPD